jgi:flagellar FliJ protein
MFRPSFETVLKHRKRVEENLQRQLAELEKSLADEKQTLLGYKSSIRELSAELKQRQMKGSPVSDISLYLSFMKQLSRDIRAQEKSVLQLGTQVELKRRDLLKATQKKKTLEKLKERHMKAQMHARQKQEQAFLDETGIHQFNKAH